MGSPKDNGPSRAARLQFIIGKGNLVPPHIAARAAAAAADSRKRAEAAGGAIEACREGSRPPLSPGPPAPPPRPAPKP